MKINLSFDRKFTESQTHIQKSQNQTQLNSIILFSFSIHQRPKKKLVHSKRRSKPLRMNLIKHKKLLPKSTPNWTKRTRLCKTWVHRLPFFFELLSSTLKRREMTFITIYRSISIYSNWLFQLANTLLWKSIWFRSIIISDFWFIKSGKEICQKIYADFNYSFDLDDFVQRLVWIS